MRVSEFAKMEQVNLFARYTNTGDNMEMMDKAAESIVNGYPAQSIGSGTDLISGERDIQWRMWPRHAREAADKLKAAGFRVDITPVFNRGRRA